MVFEDVSGLVDDLLDVNLELPSLHFFLDFLIGAGLVGVVDVDEVGLDVVRNRLIVFRLPELGLPGTPLEVVLAHFPCPH